MKKFKSVFEYQVTFSDCDPASMAYTPRILEWLDWSSEHLWRQVDYPWHKFFNVDGMGGQPLLDIQISFHHPMRHGDQLAITTWIESFAGRTFTEMHEVHVGDTLAARSTWLRAWVIRDPEADKGIRAVPVPDEVRALFHRG